MLQQKLLADVFEIKLACIGLYLYLKVSWSLLQAMPKDDHVLCLMFQQPAKSIHIKKILQVISPNLLQKKQVENL